MVVGMTVPGDLFGGDPAAVERGLDEWVAGFERKAERYQELQQRVEGVRITATSPNGVVTVTVDADGSLVDAKFTDQVARSAPDEVGRQLMAAINQAKAQITARVREVAGDTLGEDGAERIAGYYAQKFADPGEPDPPSTTRTTAATATRRPAPPVPDDSDDVSVFDDR